MASTSLEVVEWLESVEIAFEHLGSSRMDLRVEGWESTSTLELEVTTPLWGLRVAAHAGDCWADLALPAEGIDPDEVAHTFPGLLLFQAVDARTHGRLATTLHKSHHPASQALGRVLQSLRAGPLRSGEDCPF